jgi:hypothetical protein
MKIESFGVKSVSSYEEQHVGGTVACTMTYGQNQMLNDHVF